MTQIEALKRKIDSLYEERRESRDEWADWLHKNHIFIVAEIAHDLAKRYDANDDLAIAAAMLHDIADAVMSRFAPDHEKTSAEIGRKLLQETGFTEEEIRIVMDDAIRYHSCRNGEVPKTTEGKVMATADALAHLQTDFYAHAVESKRDKQSIEEIKDWGLAKIDRDFKNKILFPEIQKEAESSYERQKSFFINLT